jgi:hypothetical protein
MRTDFEGGWGLDIDEAGQLYLAMGEERQRIIPVQVDVQTSVSEEDGLMSRTIEMTFHADGAPEPRPSDVLNTLTIPDAGARRLRVRR